MRFVASVIIIMLNSLQDFLSVFIDVNNTTGWPRHRENREFGCSFFQTGKTRNLPKNIKNMILHREFASNTGKILLKF